MPATSTNFLKAALRVLHSSRVDHLAGKLLNDCGVIFMLHHVGPDTNKEFEPNKILRVRPDFLESVINEVIASGFDIIALDDLPQHLANSERTQKPFACFTFDDGYKDNRDYAYPIFKKKNLPFAVYVPADFADGAGDLWWLVLEQCIAKVNKVVVQMDGDLRTYTTETTDEKIAAYNHIYWWLRKIPEDRARTVVADLAKSAGLNTQGLCRDLVMNWDELREFAKDPLVTIGAHTNGHYALAKLPKERARAQMKESIQHIEQQLGRPCKHFSYPYGGENDAGEREFKLARQLGVETAVTTRKGLLHPAHINDLTALPRLSLNGNFQDISYVKTLLSGVPFALLNAVKAVKGEPVAV